MDHNCVMETEIQHRLHLLQHALVAGGWEATVVMQNVDLFYFSGTMQNALLFVPASGDPILMVRKHWERAIAESPIKEVIPVASLQDVITVLKNKHGGIPRTIGIELDVLPASVFLRMQELLHGAEIYDSAPLIKDIRKIKSTYEIDLMREAGRIGAIVYAEVPKVLTEGMTEIELAGIMQHVAMRHGHQSYLRMRAFNAEAFSWHVLSGYTGGLLSYIDAPMGGMGLSPAFPVGASSKPIDAHEPILIDFGICYQGYQIDETRMFCLGKLPEEFKDAYCASRHIEVEVTAAAKAGTSCDKLFQRGWDVAKRLGYEQYFMGPPGYKTRFIGHGIGLELDEYPFIAQGHDYPLEEGMTLALEPKMVFPGEGAVGIENTYVVGSNGVKKLTPADEELIEV